ncbi:hypothetical protein [Xenorhabdus indica]|uniref:hypothetical protein n=1 Tax=Xenorhabdus indica TaxID=333964 RepID=UPI00165709C0|nr:hypothetical protein [Xenorhabdus indica]MBC8945383.1 phage tail tape measure protein [Xenorhabdus indica]
MKQFFNDHPTVAKYLSIAAAGLGIILTVMGAITLVLATLLGPLAMVRLGFSLLGIKGAGSLSLLGGAFKILAGVIRGATALMMANPILAILGMIALAA